jgi:hypothetical protein
VGVHALAAHIIIALTNKCGAIKKTRGEEPRAFENLEFEVWAIVAHCLKRHFDVDAMTFLAMTVDRHSVRAKPLLVEFKNVRGLSCLFFVLVRHCSVPHVPAAPPAFYGTQTKFLVSRLAQPPAGLGLYGKDFVCTL